MIDHALPTPQTATTAVTRPTVREGVFIGGAGQSGASTLNRFLSGHPDVLTCGLETCFIIAANGLTDVVRAVSDEYSPFRLDVILHEFDRLMHHHLCSPRSYPYNQFDLAQYFGRERYHAAVDRFFGRLRVVRYQGDGLTIGPSVRVGGIHSPCRLKGLPIPTRTKRERSYLYYSERQSRERAVSAARSLLDDLFGAKARAEGKNVWCEQTSTNQQCADLLIELCPSGLYIEVVRDPLDIALAHQAQAWAPNDFSLVCTALRSLYERWFEIRGRLCANSYVEVRFEDLVAAPRVELQRICRVIGVCFDERMLAWRPDSRRLQSEQERRTGADLATYRQILGPIVEQLGYRVH